MSAPSNVHIALAAAHGITERTVATWHPSLPRDSRVMVPIQVDALVVRQAGAKWAATQMKRTPGGDGVVPAKELLPKPFSLREQDRPKGVYLHWALPDALTRGSQSASAGGSDPATASTIFPAIPDRWLIVRLSPSLAHADRRAVRGWILQAHDDNPQPIALDGWREPGKAPDAIKSPLTALGYGDVSWAGYFDNTENRLAFFDGLSDITAGPLAYLVCGWYSDVALDPLGSSTVRSLAEFDARMKALGWSLPAGDLDESKATATGHVVAARALGLPVHMIRSSATINAFDNAATVGGDSGLRGFDPQSGTYSSDGSWWPQLTILHGSVIGIGWPDVGWAGHPCGLWNPKIVAASAAQAVGGPPASSDIQAAMGHTITEAMARLVATSNNRQDETRILEAFQLNALNLLSEPDGNARVDALLHAIGFGSLPGGETTETVWQPPTSTNEAPPANPPRPDPGVFARYQHSAVDPGARDKVRVAASRLGAVRPAAANSPQFLKEVTIETGGLASVLSQVDDQVPPPPQPGEWVQVKRSLPRFFHPTDPIVLIRGGKAAFKHRSGRFSSDGMLYCRLTGDVADEISSRAPAIGASPDSERPWVRGADLLERGVENGSVPPECDGLLHELAVLDPGTAPAAGRSVADRIKASAVYADAVAENFLVEQTVWHATRDPRVDHGPLLTHSGIGGRLPSAIAVSLPAHPWTPLRLDWAADFHPSTNGLDDWALEEIDYEPLSVNPGTPVSFQGSSILTPAANTIVASAIRKALEQAASSGGSTETDPTRTVRFFSETARKAVTAISKLAIHVTGDAAGIPSNQRLALDDIASALADMDVLTGGLEGLLTMMRGGFAGDGVSAPPAGDPAPVPLFQLRAGFLRLTALRLVDCFGQFVDLLETPEEFDAAAVIKSDPMIVQDQPTLALLPPRFTAPARIWFRFLDGAGSGRDANSDPQSGNTISPVCGYLMPNHLDDALEFFDVDGGQLGFVRPQDDQTVVWEDAPGTPSTVGQNPERVISNACAGGLATALIRWGIVDAGVEGRKDNALQALLRVIDSTRWSIDPYGHAGDEHLAMLVGHPVVIVRAQLRLELQEPIQPDVANLTVIPVRLGALANWQDGLYGYFVNDDYTRLHCSDAAAAGLARAVGRNQGFLQAINLVPQHFETFVDDTGATPVAHAYVDTSGVLWIRPNQDIALTLLMEPNTVVHATAGLVPRKEIGLRREWVNDALARLSPTFRFGPVLVDPQRIRMPLATDINGTWSWDYRSDASTWVELPVQNATQDAILPVDPPSGTEGWLRLTPPPPKASSGGGQ
jgi:hypothetical protein